MIATIPTCIPQDILKKTCLATQSLPFKTPPLKTYVVWSKEYDSDPGLMWLRGIVSDAIKHANEEKLK